MKILVPIKRVVDYNVQVKPNSENTNVDLSNAKMSINPFCEIAVEEAVRIKEKNPDTEIIVVSVGEKKCQDQLRAALAMGADRAILIETNEAFQPLLIAKYLHKIIEREMPQLVITGKQAIDGDNNQTGQILAALCAWPQGTFCSKISINDDSIEVERDVDGGIETLSLKMPAVVTADLRLNEPRFVSLPNIMKAKKKPLELISSESFEIISRISTTLLSVSVPKPRAPGIRVKTTNELFEKLKNEAKVI